MKLVPVPKDAGGFAAVGALLGAFLVSQANHVAGGNGTPVAFRYLGLTLAALLLALALGRKWHGMGPRAHATVLGLGALGVVWQAMQLATMPPAIHVQGMSMFDYVFRVSAFTVLAVSAVSQKPWLGRWHSVAAIAAFCWASAWILRASPHPHIDVFTVNNEAIDGLFRGENPWSMKFRNIYGSTRWYGPGTADNNWVYVGFPYPPMSLLIAAAGRFFGDLRWANVAALALAALAFTQSKGRFGALAAMLYLTAPRVFFTLERAWTDVYLVALVALTLLSVTRFPKAAPFLLGAALSTKQYMIFLLPFVPMLFDPRWTKREVGSFLLKTIATGLVINVPFLLMGPTVLLKALTYSQHPFRIDSLSFLVATAENGQPVWPLWIQVPLMLPVYVLAWWKGPRGPAGFALGSAGVIAVFFAFSKHAFCNHYFFVLGLACAALAFFGASASKKPGDVEPVV